jgi:hypothetical protein
MDRREWFTAAKAARFQRVESSIVYRAAAAGQVRHHILPGGWDGDTTAST